MMQVGFVLMGAVARAAPFIVGSFHGYQPRIPLPANHFGQHQGRYSLLPGWNRKSFKLFTIPLARPSQAGGRHKCGLRYIRFTHIFNQ